MSVEAKTPTPAQRALLESLAGGAWLRREAGTESYVLTHGIWDRTPVTRTAGACLGFGWVEPYGYGLRLTDRGREVIGETP